MRLVIVAATVLSACASAGGATPPPPASIARLSAPAGAELGFAKVQQVPTGAVIELEVHGLAPGWHGVHIHATGDCSAPDFTSAGPHVHDDTIEHGYLTGGGGEAGDLPNLWVAADGTGRAQFYSDRVSLTGAAGRATLWDADGSAIVIHAARDDQFTQPIGASGSRVACGVLSH